MQKLRQTDGGGGGGGIVVNAAAGLDNAELIARFEAALAKRNAAVSTPVKIPTAKPRSEASLLANLEKALAKRDMAVATPIRLPEPKPRIEMPATPIEQQAVEIHVGHVEQTLQPSFLSRLPGTKTIASGIARTLVNKAAQDLIYTQIEDRMRDLGHPTFGKITTFGLRLVVDFATNKVMLLGPQMLAPVADDQQAPPPPVSTLQFATTAAAAPTTYVGRILQAGQTAFERQFGATPKDALATWIGGELTQQISYLAVSILMGQLTPSQVLEELMRMDALRRKIITGGLGAAASAAWNGLKSLGTDQAYRAADLISKRIVMYAVSTMTERGLVGAFGAKLADRVRRSKLGEIKLLDADYLGLVAKFRSKLAQRGVPAAQMEFLDATLADLAIGVTNQVTNTLATMAVNKAAGTVWTAATAAAENPGVITNALESARATVTQTFFGTLAKGAESMASALQGSIDAAVGAFGSVVTRPTGNPDTVADETSTMLPSATRTVEQRRQLKQTAIANNELRKAEAERQRQADRDRRIAARRAVDQDRTAALDRANYDLANEQMVREQREAQRLVETGADKDALRRYNEQLMSNFDPSRFIDFKVPAPRQPLPQATATALGATAALGEGIKYEAPARQAAKFVAGSWASKAAGVLDSIGSSFDATLNSARLFTNVARTAKRFAWGRGATVADAAISDVGLKNLDAFAGQMAAVPTYAETKQKVLGMLTGQTTNDDMVDLNDVTSKFTSNVLLNFATAGKAGMEWQDAALEAVGDATWGLKASSTAQVPDVAWQAARAGTYAAATQAGAHAKRLYDFMSNAKPADNDNREMLAQMRLRTPLDATATAAGTYAGFNY
jgi:hypothetical protein